ncbi:hypothetical protein BJ912DRAFT_849140 [Pholiota molesta]|nr:hypothetical protein BJ912DRAFT_849140 [Pholiota molesta]
MSLFILLAYYLGSQSVLGASTRIPIPVILLRCAYCKRKSLCSTTDCDQRSILGIFWSCLATVLASSWVAVHPNIPPPGSKSYQGALARAELMIWTILAPECTIYWAVRQWLGARKLEKTYRSAIGQGWTMTHGFSCKWAGCLSRRQRYQRSPYPEPLGRTYRQSLFGFPNIVEEDIRHCSKADGLSKFLVIVQVTWFITQYTAELCKGSRQRSLS